MPIAKPASLLVREVMGQSEGGVPSRSSPGTSGSSHSQRVGDIATPSTLAPGTPGRIMPPGTPSISQSLASPGIRSGPAVFSAANNFGDQLKRQFSLAAGMTQGKGTGRSLSVLQNSDLGRKMAARSALKLQCCTRQYFARKQLKALQHSRLDNHSKAARVMQRCWDAFKWRKRLKMWDLVILKGLMKQDEGLEEDFDTNDDSGIPDSEGNSMTSSLGLLQRFEHALRLAPSQRRRIDVQAIADGTRTHPFFASMPVGMHKNLAKVAKFLQLQTNSVAIDGSVVSDNAVIVLHGTLKRMQSKRKKQANKDLEDGVEEVTDSTLRDVISTDGLANGGCVVNTGALINEDWVAGITWVATEYTEVLLVDRNNYQSAAKKFHGDLQEAGQTVVNFLSYLPLFAEVPLPDVIKAAKVAYFSSAAAGTVIANQGDTVKGCWIVVQGECAVVRQEGTKGGAVNPSTRKSDNPANSISMVLRNLGAGQCFGLSSLIVYTSEKMVYDASLVAQSRKVTLLLLPRMAMIKRASEAMTKALRKFSNQSKIWQKQRKNEAKSTVGALDRSSLTLAAHLSSQKTPGLRRSGSGLQTNISLVSAMSSNAVQNLGEVLQQIEESKKSGIQNASEDLSLNTPPPVNQPQPGARARLGRSESVAVLPRQNMQTGLEEHMVDQSSSKGPVSSIGQLSPVNEGKKSQRIKLSAEIRRLQLSKSFSDREKARRLISQQEEILNIHKQALLNASAEMADTIHDAEKQGLQSGQAKAAMFQEAIDLTKSKSFNAKELSEEAAGEESTKILLMLGSKPSPKLQSARPPTATESSTMVSSAPAAIDSRAGLNQSTDENLVQLSFTRVERINSVAVAPVSPSVKANDVSEGDSNQGNNISKEKLTTPRKKFAGLKVSIPTAGDTIKGASSDSFTTPPGSTAVVKGSASERDYSVNISSQYKYPGIAEENGVDIEYADSQTPSETDAMPSPVAVIPDKELMINSPITYTAYKAGERAAAADKANSSPLTVHADRNDDQNNATLPTAVNRLRERAAKRNIFSMASTKTHVSKSVLDDNTPVEGVDFMPLEKQTGARVPVASANNSESQAKPSAGHSKKGRGFTGIHTKFAEYSSTSPGGSAVKPYDAQSQIEWGSQLHGVLKVRENRWQGRPSSSIAWSRNQYSGSKSPRHSRPSTSTSYHSQTSLYELSDIQTDRKSTGDTSRPYSARPVAGTAKQRTHRLHGAAYTSQGSALKPTSSLNNKNFGNQFSNPQDKALHGAVLHAQRHLASRGRLVMRSTAKVARVGAIEPFGANALGVASALESAILDGTSFKDSICDTEAITETEQSLPIPDDSTNAGTSQTLVESDASMSPLRPVDLMEEGNMTTSTVTGWGSSGLGSRTADQSADNFGAWTHQQQPTTTGTGSSAPLMSTSTVAESGCIANVATVQVGSGLQVPKLKGTAPSAHHGRNSQIASSYAGYGATPTPAPAAKLRKTNPSAGHSPPSLSAMRKSGELSQGRGSAGSRQTNKHLSSQRIGSNAVRKLLHDGDVESGLASAARQRHGHASSSSFASSAAGTTLQTSQSPPFASSLHSKGSPQHRDKLILQSPGASPRMSSIGRAFGAVDPTSNISIHGLPALSGN